MGDFLLDFRPRAQRQMARAAAGLRFFEDLNVVVIEEDAFGLVLVSPDDPKLWGPFRTPDQNVLVALCGRVAFAEKTWQAAASMPGDGGLACKAIYDLYQSGGVAALEGLNGNFALVVYDRSAGVCHLLTDRCGMSLAYHRTPIEQALVFCSHPDVLASVVGEAGNLDLTSLAGFLSTGHLTFPYTYFHNLRGLPTGCTHTFGLRDGYFVYQTHRRFFDFPFHIDERESEADLARQLAAAFAQAVARRTLPLLGRTAVGLSGGLDSRAILSTCTRPSEVLAFTLYDDDNTEIATARKLAAACAVEFLPLQRDFEYYARSAELGVRISGGTGSFASNHFLGIRDRLRELNIQNLVTGCYCDYLLKALALNTTEQPVTRHERQTAFHFQFYRPHYAAAPAFRTQLQERNEALFPESQQVHLSPSDWLLIERKRAFPLAYEGDLAQRVIPQRVLPWFVPIVDNEIIATYLKIPSRFKLNGALFKKMVLLLCNERVRRIPDSNTGAALDASLPRYSLHRYLSALRNRMVEKLKPRMATRGSWPNWGYYLQHSTLLPSLWQRPNGTSRDLLVQLLGRDPFRVPLAGFQGRDLELFLRLLTLKLWLDQRV